MDVAIITVKPVRFFRTQDPYYLDRKNRTGFTVFFCNVRITLYYVIWLAIVKRRPYVIFHGRAVMAMY
jgi:hypothetical protein